MIVSKCFDFTKMLGKLVQRQADDLPVMTLARGDEMPSAFVSTNKRSQVREDASDETKNVFHGGRNFK